jgi:LPS export ABC transporter protein LptC
MRFRALVVGTVVVASAACTDVGRTPPQAAGATVADSADQVLFGVRTIITDRGVQRAELFADTALTYDDNTRTDLRVVRSTFFTATGVKNATLTARRGSYNVRLGDMEARGNVIVLSEDGRKLETPQLKFDPSRNEISSDSAFVLTEAERKTEGIGFTSDPAMTNIRIFRAAKVSGVNTKTATNK